MKSANRRRPGPWLQRAFWKFAEERQAIFFRRLSGEPTHLWTSDRILRDYRFTNIYRASDRTTQFLIRYVQYGSHWDERNLIFRTILFKLFNRIGTWEMLETQVGEPCLETFRVEEYDEILSRAKGRGAAIYSGAYIMPSGRAEFGSRRKHRNHLRLLQWIIRQGGIDRLLAARSLEELTAELLRFPTIGRFLAYQYAVDLNYSEIFNFSENEFVIPGPGAKSGIRKCYGDLSDNGQCRLLQDLVDRQEEHASSNGACVEALFGRRLHLIDVQNVFCEFDKYSRVAFPTAAGHQGRTKMKRRYTPSRKPITYWFPPKWSLDTSG